ncbi:MAG: Omp28-related outer membrane protein [Bacteroidota bacterium]
MKQYRFLLLICIGLLANAACDIIEAPYVENNVKLPTNEQCLIDAAAQEAFPAGQTITRKVLFEEVTGHTCGQCPEQSAIAYDLYQNTRKGEMVIVYIHSGFFAKVKSGDKYTTDFTTETGDELETYFNDAAAYPFGMTDRQAFNAGDGNEWSKHINSRLEEPAEAGIRIYNCYDDATSELTTVVDVLYLADAGEEEYVTVYLIEDKVVDWQKDYDSPQVDLPDYNHHNVLRAAINGTWGQPLTTEAVQKDDRFTVSYSFTIPAEYNVANCKVVAFVHDFDTRIVRQAEEAAVIQ